MPIISLGSRHVGILPIIQITFLPALSIYAAADLESYKKVTGKTYTHFAKMT
ncbi:MAG TPA: hypothetical protein VF181_06860 [Balneolaceae bacterium]